MLHNPANLPFSLKLIQKEVQGTLKFQNIKWTDMIGWYLKVAQMIAARKNKPGHQALST